MPPHPSRHEPGQPARRRVAAHPRGVGDLLALGPAVALLGRPRLAVGQRRARERLLPVLVTRFAHQTPGQGGR